LALAQHHLVVLELTALILFSVRLLPLVAEAAVPPAGHIVQPGLMVALAVAVDATDILRVRAVQVILQIHHHLKEIMVEPVITLATIPMFKVAAVAVLVPLAVLLNLLPLMPLEMAVMEQPRLFLAHQ
jgi:hypothetical protein